MILGLEYHRSAARYLATRTATGTKLGGRMAGLLVGNMAPLRLTNLSEPRRPGDDWTRLKPLLSGICGSDLGLLSGSNSPYLSPMISTPFVPGHEVVAETMDELPGLPKGSRVVMDPVLSCRPRGVEPCLWCATGRESRCDRITGGAVSSGLQTGYCGDTGGGWSKQFVAHASQLHPVPDELSDERAVLVEPIACAVHSVRRVHVPAGASVLLIGAGTVGLFTLLALREFTQAGPIYVVAKHRHQRERALQLGATEVFEPKRAARALRRATGGSLQHPQMGEDFLLGGADIAFECTGGAGGLTSALRMVRAGGTVVASGIPSSGVDLTPLWYRELSLVGAYASDHGGPEQVTDDVPNAAEERTRADGRAGDFTEAVALAGTAPLDGYVDAVYSLSQWRDAIGHAFAAGRLGTVKVAFAPGQQ
ncbi:alcohol dehydrogenase [Actinocatenispora thailandica]|uniref:Alcohol dehydrogenase n=1 Tax=Actinocatenispora thailandica TaxID=227318 RepID=A0A7R7DNQ0_9ACTN|nr:zinc-binding dehydrogenase [Actinocatenispora thailandica]BCJ35085.1 alcohol dehydrogenase [Actinocatenispora thailandica]